MGTFRNTNEINKEYAENRVASPVANSGWDKFSMWSMGMDRYGNQKGAGSKMLSGLTNLVTGGLPYAAARNVRQKYKGEAGGAKIRNQAKNRAIETGVSQALAVATLGASGAFSSAATTAATTAASTAGATGASALGATTGSTTGVVASEAAKSALSTATTETAKGVAIETGKTAGTALGKETVKGGVKQFGKELLQEIGGEKTKLLLDFVKGFKGKGDVAGKEFLKSFYAENKKEILKLGADEIKGLLSNYKGKYSQYKDDTRMTSTYSTMDGETSYRDANNKSTMMFKKGGKVEGKSHAEGGEKATVGDTNIEVEGGEEIFSVKDTKKMESFMKKKDAKGLGKFVMGTMAKHRDNPQPTYAEGGTSDLAEGESESSKKMTTAEVYRIAKEAGAKFPEITAAQWALESARGKSKLSKDTNNYFGIKYNEAAAKKLRDRGIDVVSSKEVNPDGYYDKAEKSSADYMYFKDPSDSIRAHQIFLETNPRYKDALNAEDAASYAKELKKAGYATDPTYAEKLVKIVAGEAKRESFGKEFDYGLKYDDEKTQTKYESYRKGNQFNIPEANDLYQSVSKFKNNEEFQTASEEILRKQEIERNNYSVLEEKIKKYENGELKIPEGVSLENLKSESKESRVKAYVAQTELIDLQYDNALKFDKEISEKANSLKATLEADYASGKIDKETYERNNKAVVNLIEFKDNYLSKSTESKNILENTKGLKKEYNRLYDEEKLNKLKNEYNMIKDPNTWVSDGAGKAARSKMLQSQIDVMEGQASMLKEGLDENRTFIKDFEVDGASLKGFSFDYGLNYSDEDKAKFESDTERYVEENAVDEEEVVVDAETDYNVDKVIMSEDVLKQVLQQRDAKQEATGLKGVVEKFGGTDKVLELTGMYAAYKSATTPMPEQRKSEAWTDNMARMKDRTQLGLDNATKTLYQRNAERTYAYDVKNIGRTATSGQAALGALGSASARKYDADLTMAAKDAMVRDANQAAYTSALAVDENMTQDMWKRNVYDEAARKRDLKSGLIGKAVSNMRDDLMYDKQYGDGSMYDQLMKETMEEKKNTNEALRIAKAKKMIDANQWTEAEAIDYYTKQNQPEPEAPKSSIATMIENTFNKIKK